MLVFPNWRAPVANDGCRVPQWTPPERFASYIARPFYIPPPQAQLEEEDSTGGSSPERQENGEGEVVACEWRGCGVHLAGVARLSAHVSRTHAQAHRDGLFYCGWKGCTRPQRGFNARYKMLVHVRTHTNERPHTCNLCNKSFSRAENLKIHLRSHSGEKPYVCPYEGCGKAYSNSSDRFKHTRTHTVDKPYFCKVSGCNKRYTDPSSLRKHVKTYKHYAPKDTHKMDTTNSSDDLQTPERSPEIQQPKENIPSRHEIKVPSPVRVSVTYSPTTCPMSPLHTSYSLQHADTQRLPVSIPAYGPPVDQVTYIRPYSEPMYSMRVPAYEMSYMEYTQMYDHAYRNYYGLSYPVLRSSSGEEVTYDPYTEVTKNKKAVDVSRYSPMEVEEMPLNLKCTKRVECKSIEELVRRTDLPLDLSTKS